MTTSPLTLGEGPATFIITGKNALEWQAVPQILALEMPYLLILVEMEAPIIL